MKVISEKKETVQTIELDKEDFIDCVAMYLKTKGVTVPDKAQFCFNIQIGPTSRDVEQVKVMLKTVEEGPPTNGIGVCQK